MDIKIALGKIEQYWQIIRNLHFHIEQEGKISPEEYALIEKYLKVITLKYSELVEEVEKESSIEVPPVAPVYQEPIAPIVNDNSSKEEVVVEESIAEEIVQPVFTEEQVQVEIKEEPLQNISEEPIQNSFAPIIEQIAPELKPEAPRTNSISSFLEQMLDHPDQMPERPVLFTTENTEKKTPSLNDRLKEMKSPVDDLNSKIKKATAEKISLNDKFEFIRELFGNNSIEYANAIQIFDTYGSQGWDKVESLFAERFNWSARPGSVEKLKRLVNSR